MKQYRITYELKEGHICATAYAWTLRVIVVVEADEMTDDVRRGIETRLFQMPGDWQVVEVKEIS